jgi:hypothetical protein
MAIANDSGGLVRMIMSEPRDEAKRKSMLVALEAKHGQDALSNLGPTQDQIIRTLNSLLRSEGGLLAAVNELKFDDVAPRLEQTNEARWAGAILFQPLQLFKCDRFPTIMKIAAIHAKRTK